MRDSPPFDPYLTDKITAHVSEVLSGYLKKRHRHEVDWVADQIVEAIEQEIVRARPV